MPRRACSEISRFAPPGFGAAFILHQVVEVQEAFIQAGANTALFALHQRTLPGLPLTSANICSWHRHVASAAVLAADSFRRAFVRLCIAVLRHSASITSAYNKRSRFSPSS